MASFADGESMPVEKVSAVQDPDSKASASKAAGAAGGAEDDDDDDEEDGVDGEIAGESADKKKKKRKPKKKKNKGPVGSIPAISRNLGGFTDYYTKYGQTNPPSKPVADLFKDGCFPIGEIQKHGKTSVVPIGGGWEKRENDDEKREKERLLRPQVYEQVRHASEVHRQVRRWSQSWIKPGIKLTDMCEKLEEMNRSLVRENGLQCGIGFPTGCSLNHVAAHYTPNVGDDTVLKEGDVMKIDFGTQIDGRIIDCAWTVAFDEKFDPLLEAVKEATETGIRAAGIDVQMCEIGAQIQEVMESHEIELDGKTHKIKC